MISAFGNVGGSLYNSGQLANRQLDWANASNANSQLDWASTSNALTNSLNQFGPSPRKPIRFRGSRYDDRSSGKRFGVIS